MAIQRPFFSVITVCYNSDQTLRKAMQSLLVQSCSDYEYIIVDGQSTDGTSDIINTYRDYIDIVISEPDNGIYDAMNKGISVSNGKFIVFLNSDDLFFPYALSVAKSHILNSEGSLLFYASVYAGSTIRDKLSAWKIFYTFNFFPSHSVGFFVDRRVHDIAGLYSLDFECSADYDFMYRCLVLYGFKSELIRFSQPLGFFALDGYSNQRSYVAHIKEQAEIRVKNGQISAYVRLIYLLLRLRGIILRKG